MIRIPKYQERVKVTPLTTPHMEATVMSVESVEPGDEQNRPTFYATIVVGDEQYQAHLIELSRKDDDRWIWGLYDPSQPKLASQTIRRSR